MQQTFRSQANSLTTKDDVTINPSLATAATNVRVWTYSFNGGANFDPIVAVFDATTGAKLAENDDNDTLAPGQTFFDAGIVFSSLAAGNYFFSMAVFPNFSKGSNFANGFRFDNQTGAPITTGTFYRLHLSGLDTASVSGLPEPATAWFELQVYLVYLAYVVKKLLQLN